MSGERKEVDFLQYCIITPTYRGHFQFIPKYLDSYCRFVRDAREMPVVFTVSREEIEDFQALIAPYTDRANISVLAFDDILASFGVTESCGELLAGYGRFSFQSMKKFYTMLYVKAEKYLILDCESAWVRKCVMGEEFERYFAAPFVAGSLLATRERMKKVLKYELEYVDALLGNACDRWTIETFMWYVERSILEDMCRSVGSPYECARKVREIEKNLNRKPGGYMEALLYQDWLYLNRERYGYRLIDVDEELRRCLPGELCQRYRDRFMDKYSGGSGYLERPTECLDRETLPGLVRIYLDNDIRIARFQKTETLECYRIQREFFRQVQPCILACSQNNGILDRRLLQRLYLGKVRQWLGVRPKK